MYRVICPSCAKPYDAEKSLECSCLQPVRSFQCPHCAACFCKAGKSFLDAFWRDATPKLWDARRARSEKGPPPEMNEPPEMIRRPMVLFADDDPAGRAIARQVIRGLNYGVVVAENGERALELARQYKPDLIITDALMPRLDGREMGRTIKQELPKTKVVVITSVYKDPRYKHEALSRFEVNEYLAKPVKAGDLRAVVMKYLG